MEFHKLNLSPPQKKKKKKKKKIQECAISPMTYYSKLPVSHGQHFHVAINDSNTK